MVKVTKEPQNVIEKKKIGHRRYRDALKCICIELPPAKEIAPLSQKG